MLAKGAAAIAAILFTLSGHGAWSQTARTIKIVVTFTPGGLVDFVARVLAEQVGRAQGQTVLIEKRPGAGGVIGTEAVARAAPDGNTLLMAGADFLVTQHLRKLNYDLLTSFEPICNLVSYPTIIAVNSASLRAGSEIVFSFILPDDEIIGDEGDLLTIGSVALAQATGELWKSRLQPRKLVKLLSRFWFSDIFHLTPELAQERYFAGRKDGLRAPRLAQMIAAIV